jgi:predicted tellurium resistance membrane protein TerC
MEHVIALVALAAMEIVLGIDNIVFISIVSSRLPPSQQPLARRLGLLLALVTRLLLLFTLSYIVTQLVEPIFNLTGLGVPKSWIDSEHFEEVNGISWKDIILLVGGMFLIGKSVHEIHQKFDSEGHASIAKKAPTFSSVLIQIALLDVIFSLDSVITAVGMVDEILVMVVAIVIAMGVMLLFAEMVNRFVEQNPTIKMLAMSFLILIGVILVAEAIGQEIDKRYIYFAMAFALAVEALNIRLRHKEIKRKGSETAEAK